MEVDFMDSNYKCFIDIRFSGGDIQFDVSSDTQLFSFKSGIGFVAIPHFFSTLSSLYKGEISETKLDCHGNFDYYIFSSDGTNLFIEHISHYPDGIFKYQFKLKEYIEAIYAEFQKYLQQLEKEGILPLKNQEYAHPLGDDVLSAFYDFSLLLNR
ncbi:hypothetical protein C3943_17210 [Lysinibacillus sp. B2A1]|nr:hypothetical protein C3943_17210 [Lysinibacillus sp. B2A1]